MPETSSGGTSWNDTVIEQFLAGKDRIADTFDRSSLLLLGTTGARSGQPRTSPLAYFTDGDRLVIVASAAGRDTHPSWYFNILARPQVTIRRWDGDRLESFAALATPAEGAERDRLFAEVARVAPGFAEYQANTTRVLPVVILHRV